MSNLSIQPLAHHSVAKLSSVKSTNETPQTQSYLPAARAVFKLVVHTVAIETVLIYDFPLIMTPDFNLICVTRKMAREKL